MRRIILLACLLIALPAHALTLKIATIAPDGTGWMQAMRRGAEEIAHRTQGRVQFRFYPGGIMGNDKSVLRKIRIGQLQGSALTGIGLAEINPDINIYGLPFIFRSYAEVDYVRKRMDPLIVKGLKKKGFIGFALVGGGFAYLLSKQPIQSADDLKGRKTWIPQGDRISQVGLETLGVSPVPLPLTDVLTGLQTGLIDTVGNSPIGTIALQWHTKVKYLTDAPLFYLQGAIVIQRKAFQRLSTQDQAIVSEVMTNTSTQLNAQNRQDNENARQALVRQGIVFLQPAPEERQRLESLMVAPMDRLGKQGFFSLAMLKQLRNSLADYRRTHGSR